MSKKIKRFLTFLFGTFLIIFSAKAYISPTVYITQFKINSTEFKSGETIIGSFTVLNNEEFFIPNISQEFMIFIPDENLLPKIEINKVLAKEKLLLAPKEQKTINFSYELPENLMSGSYYFRVSLFGDNGLLISWEDQPIHISGNEKFLKLENPKIIKDGEEFLPLIGPNFAKDHSPKIRFEVLNSSLTQISAIPRISIFERQTNLKKVRELKKESLTLNAGEKRIVEYEMPTLEKPEAYLAEVKFFDLSENLISNSLFFRWVVEGKGAKIIALESTQNYFSKGDLTKINVCYLGPADGSKIGEGELLVEIYNEKGQISGKTSKVINLDEMSCVLLEIPIEKETRAANIKATISQAGEILEEYKTGPLKKFEKIRPKREVIPIFLYVFFGIIILIATCFIGYKLVKIFYKSLKK